VVSPHKDCQKYEKKILENFSWCQKKVRITTQVFSYFVVLPHIWCSYNT
jgi:hypothetical protein